MTTPILAVNLKPGDVIVSAPHVVGTVATSERDFDNLSSQIVLLTDGTRYFVGAYDIVRIAQPTTIN